MAKYRELLGKRLKQRMDQLELTQADFADRLGINQSMVSAYVNAKIEPGLDLIERWALALEVTPAWLLSEHNFEESESANKRLALIGDILGADANLLDAVFHVLEASPKAKNIARSRSSK